MNWEPPGFAHGRVAGCGSQSEARLRGFHRPRLRNPTWDPARVGGGAHQEGGKIASPLVPTDRFPAVASRPNAQTTRTTPSVGRRWRPTSVHLDFHLLPSGFPAKTHTPLHSTLLSSLSPNTQRRDWTERERARSLSGRSTASLAVSRSGEEKRGRKRAERRRRRH